MKRKIEIEVAILIVVAICVGVLFSFYSSNKKTLSLLTPLPSGQNNKTSQQTSLENPPQFQISPDGSKKLTMTVATNKDFTKTYTFTTANSDGTNSLVALRVTLGRDTMSIPFNTWSPDNKYFFVTHNSPNGKEAIVAKADGSQLVENQASFNVTDHFLARNTGTIYDETTGWASGTLLIINSKMQDKTKGPSYWFEVPSQAIIALSTEF